MAHNDLFFVDPFLDADFVSRYLTQVSPDTSVRLLGRKCMPSLLPAVEQLQKQSGLKIEVRVGSDFHDRYIFIDKQSCYHSGASFKDGAQKAPTMLTQITDALDAVLATYESKWASATKPS